MADTSLAARSAFADLHSLKHPAFSIDVRNDVTLATIAAFKGTAAAVREAMHAAYGIALPSMPERIDGPSIAVLWNGQDQWLVVASRGAVDRDLEVELKSKLAGLAAITDQSDGRAIVRVSGTRVRDVLAKGLPIDLHPRAFRANSVAITHAAHIGVMIWQIDDTPAYDLAVARSFAGSFASWLTYAAAEYIGQ